MRITARLDFGGGDDPIRLGEIAWSDADRMAAIEWDPSFVAAPLPVSPFLVREMSSLHHPEDRRAFDGLPALFGDSVPDGWGRMLMDREIERRKLMGPIALCRLAMVGHHGMGALTYQPADKASVADGLNLDRFSQEAREVEGGDDDALTRLRTISGGSQGARPKFVALLDRATGAIHDHRTPWREGLTHVLIKGRSREDTKHAVEIEATYCRVAERAGVELSPSGVLRSEKGEAFFVTERFDRDRSGRFHAQTAAALAECDYRRDVLDYAQLLKMTRVLTKDDAAVEQGFRRAAFNVAMLNRDDHPKNHAFLMDRRGAWRAAPAYDLTFAPGSTGQHAMTIAGRSQGALHDPLLELADEVGLHEQRARSIMTEIAEVSSGFKETAREFDISDKIASLIQKRIDTAAGEMSRLKAARPRRPPTR